MPAEDIIHNDIRIFKTDANGPVVENTNTAVKFPSLERRSVPGKAPLSTSISIHLHEFLQARGVSTHFAERKGRTEQAVYETQPLAFDVLLRNLASGDLVSDFGIVEGYRFPIPMVEYFIRPESLDRLPVRVSESHLIANELVEFPTVEIIVQQIQRVNDLLSGVF